ncbi:MAG: hypothetical protein FJ090_11405 [Deltaproteobacteria bacterium]|nr:hypothetical protein [Deltaproteobacteria bacterium]
MNVAVPGRLCLVGEHNDWAGGASIVVPLDRHVRCRATPAPRLSATAVLEGRHLAWSGEGDPGPLRLVPAVSAELAARGLPSTATVHVDGDLPPGRGFSSSAATCVALARAIAGTGGVALDVTTAAEVAYRSERERCGVNCGRLDPVACAHGMPLFLRFSGEAYDAEPIAAHLVLAVGSFRAPRDTVGILAVLGRYFRGEVKVRDWEAVRRVGAVRGALEGFGEQARLARDALAASDLRAVGASMNVCQAIYEDELAACLPELRAPGLHRAVRALRAAGALGAKFSGAGGDGSVIGLFKPGDPRAAQGVAALDALGLDAFVTEVWCTV